MSNNLITQINIRAGVDGISDINRLADAIENAGGDVDALRRNTDGLQRTWNSLSTAEQTRQLTRLSNEAQRLRQITNDRLILGLTGDDQVRRQIQDVTQAYERLRQSGTLSARELARATQLHRQQVAQLESQLGQVSRIDLSSLAGGIKGLVGALGIGAGATEIIALADEFNNLEARIKLATSAGGDFHHAMESLRQIADDTTMPLTATADLFGKLTRATKELGLSQNEVLNLTRTINQTMSISGGSAESMEAAITQLAQGLSAGALRGDEFNSVAEQSPRLMQALADGLGVTTGKLKEMAGEGKLTAEVIANALSDQADTIAQEYAKLPNTVSGSLTVLKNSILSFIGEMDNEIQGSNGLATFISDIATGIRDIDVEVLDNLKLTFGNFGEMVKSVYDGLMSIPDAVADIISGLMGVERASDSLSLLDGIVHGVAISTGAVADGFKAIQIAITAMVAYAQKELGELADFMHKWTGFGGEFAKSMAQASEQGFAKVDELIMGFESKTAKALSNIGKTAQDKYTEMANTAKANYDKMVQDGSASSEALATSFGEYARLAIQANDNVISKSMEMELAYHNLTASIDKNGKVLIERIKEVKEGLDLSDYETSFKTLGIDMAEFAGGLSEKTNTALTAFNELAGVAKDNTEQLAMAYNGAVKAIGDNQKGLDELNAALLKATGDNKELALAVKATAQAQLDATNQTQAQQKALDALGISIKAVNAGMSQSGQKMVDNLKLGLVAIKEQIKGADNLKTAIATALDTSLAAAKTQADFKAIKDAINDAGLTAQVSGEQMAKINAGMSQSQHHLAQSTKNATTATVAHTRAISDNTKAKQHATKASTELAKSNDELSKGLGTVAKNASISQAGLSGLGIETETLAKYFDHFDKLLSDGAKGGITFYLQKFGELTARQNQGRQEMIALKDAMAKMGETLSDNAVSIHEITQAQKLLNQATNFAINDIKVMDSASLKRLHEQIDKAKQKMADFAGSAKQTVQELQSELAGLQGNDGEVLRLKHAQKLAELEHKINEARAQGNSDAIAHYQQAIELQQQINAEEHKKLTQKQSENHTPTITTPNRSALLSIQAKDIGDVWQRQLENIKEQAKSEAKQEFAKELMDDAKRRAR